MFSYKMYYLIYYCLVKRNISEKANKFFEKCECLTFDPIFRRPLTMMDSDDIDIPMGHRLLYPTVNNIAVGHTIKAN